VKPYVVRHKFANPPQWLLDGLLQDSRDARWKFKNALAALEVKK
jgi:hypothetical protein